MLKNKYIGFNGKNKVFDMINYPDTFDLRDYSDLQASYNLKQQ